MLLVISLLVGCLCAIDLKLMVADVVPISESSSSQFLAAVRTNSSAGSTLMLSGKYIYIFIYIF